MSSTPSGYVRSRWRCRARRSCPQAQVAVEAQWQRLLPIFSAPGNSAHERRIVVVTNKTFATDDFQRRLKSGDHLLIVTDEMHRAGSPRVLDVLQRTEVGATLGLSATFRRQFDEDGTNRLMDFFGPVLMPVIGLAEALTLGMLVPYDYRLHELTAGRR